MLATSPSDRLVPEGTGCSKPFVCHQDDTVLLNHNVIYNNASNVNSHTSNDNINMFYVVSFENSDEFFSSSPKNGMIFFHVFFTFILIISVFVELIPFSYFSVYYWTLKMALTITIFSYLILLALICFILNRLKVNLLIYVKLH